MKKRKIHSKIDIYLRSANIKDKQLLYWWANDEEVRENAFSKQLISSDQHELWFSKVLQSPFVKIHILVINGHPAGQVRLELEKDGVYLIDYSIDKAFRGQGLGRCILGLIEHYVPNGAVLLGQVKENNVASQQVFQRLGYQPKQNIEKRCIDYRKRIMSNVYKDVISGEDH